MVYIPEKNTRRGQANKRLDEEKARERFSQRLAWFQMERMRQRANRFQMAMDEAYYDGDQWTPDEAAAVRARGQNPVVFNEVKPIVDFLNGTERRTRVDFVVSNRTDDSPEAYQDAQNKTKLLRFVDDVNHVQYSRSQSADELFKAGMGWLEVGVRMDPSDYPIYKRSESWRHMLYDSLGQSLICEDWRYQIRFREVDFDIAEAHFPGQADLLMKALVNSDTQTYMQWYNGEPIATVGPGVGMIDKWVSYENGAWASNPRKRVLLMEVWESAPYRGEGAGQSLEDPIAMRKRVAIMTEYDTIHETWSPYKHNRFPFIPYWGYRRKGDGAPYGVIRQHRGPQDSLNKQMSKAQFRIATRQILLERGALDEEVMTKEDLEEMAGDPSAILEFARNALSGKKVEIKEGAQLAEADIKMAQEYRFAIRNSTVSTEDMGLDQTAASGRARAIRETQVSKLTAELFDHILMARQIEGEITLSLAEQYHTEQMIFAVPGQTKRAEYVRINERAADGTILNDITKRKATFTIGEAPWQQSVAEAAFESLLDMMGELAKVAPQAVLAILDIVFDLHPNLPKKEQILRRIRAATGMDDPDEADTPEGQRKKAEKEAMAKAQFQAQMAQLQADIAAARAKGEKLSAEAMSKRLEALYMAAQGAQILASTPQIAPIADALAISAGFDDRNGDPALGGPVETVNAPVPPVPQQADGALAGGMAGSQS